MKQSNIGYCCELEMSLYYFITPHAQREQGKVIRAGVLMYIYIYNIPSPLTVHFPITHSVRYQPIFHNLYFMLHCAHVSNNIILTTIMEMVEILDGRVGKLSVE